MLKALVELVFQRVRRWWVGRQSERDVPSTRGVSRAFSPERERFSPEPEREVEMNRAVPPEPEVEAHRAVSPEPEVPIAPKVPAEPVEDTPKGDRPRPRRPAGDRFQVNDVVHHPQNGDENSRVADVRELGGEPCMKVRCVGIGALGPTSFWITQRGWALVHETEAA
jgi:hypothetical protein